MKSLLCCLLLVASFVVQPSSFAALAGLSSVRDFALRAHIKFLADDLLEGRGTGARGGEIAARYLAAQLQVMGLKGAASGNSYLQSVSLVGVKADPSTVLQVKGHNRAETFRFGDEFIAFTGAQAPEVSTDTELVFVGYGIEAPEEHWNDYKGKTEDYRGKILVMLVNDPPATAKEPNLFGGKALTYYGRWTYKYEQAARRGAVGALLLHTDESAGYPWSVVRTSNGSWRFDLARGDRDRTPFLPIRAWMTDVAARRLLAMAGKDMDDLRRQAASRDFQPIALGLKASIDLKSEVKRVEAPNVVGLLEGRDSKLRNEYVVYSAHWDHLGVGEPDGTGDRIYNGAVDNASGAAAILEVASYFSHLPAARRPRRSMLFLFPTAEEQGLLGAEWYVQHPLFPLRNTVAEINLDALNVLGPTRDIIALGGERSTLHQWIEKVARKQGVHLSSEPRPEQGAFFRSDHFPFAKAGIAAVDIGSGDDFVGRPAGWGEKQFRVFNEQHYHQPSDEYRESWDLRGMVQETQFALELGREVAESSSRPRLLTR